MKNSYTIKLIAACASFYWASGSFAQHSGHMHSTQGTSATAASPYSGEQSRNIKSLSASDVAALQSGAGMGYAKAAELNGYPGPMHVLELASPLQLTSEQRAATEKLMAEHKAKARTLGGQLLDAERALDAAFVSKRIDAQRITELTQRIGTLQAALRAEHLQTHLAQTALLNPQQIASYQTLRGYDKAGDASHSHTH
jgi:Spy/CpxP family protein refolding chaperone